MVGFRGRITLKHCVFYAKVICIILGAVAVAYWSGFIEPLSESFNATLLNISYTGLAITLLVSLLERPNRDRKASAIPTRKITSHEK
ncbi:hypothetical protein N9L66_05200 [Porticoccaceae bacterium]|nr:hypothetical protein [Porticoccaceae bacterium]MDA8664339.1 hypothetical protein [Porticoccaceae bacterium]MDA8682266.1 hypothetical protein [Porticoccaceae bacterium]MDA8788882.1 hypothetical protein [Porticoccaceae bacterium]MDB2343793.1 hypothetical protein [Porticoccaceae bacterium]